MTKRDPYSDWTQVYRAEIIDRATHWPVNRRNEKDSSNESSLMEVGNNA